jgi:hypothetical protein
MPLSTRRVSSLAAVSMPILCSSCFTLGLWGFFPEDEEDAATGEYSTGFAYDPETEWSWELVGLRLLLTPFSLGLDVLTCPVQCVVFCSDAECGTCR